MFLNNIKEFLIKNKVKKELAHYKHITSNHVIKSIGIIIDESLESKKDLIVSSIINKGFTSNQIQIIVFKKKIKKEETFDFLTITLKDISYDLTFSKPEINAFINKNFDLLINYYDYENPLLMALSLKTISSFKVGFSTIDNRINQFMITTEKENSKIFIDELFKYLQILNKI